MTIQELIDSLNKIEDKSQSAWTLNDSGIPSKMIDSVFITKDDRIVIAEMDFIPDEKYQPKIILHRDAECRYQSVDLRKVKESFSIWYESNAYFGRINGLGKLKEVANYQLKEPNQIDSLDDFLDKTKLANNSVDNFGTRIEHYSGVKTLRMYLKEKYLLESFLDLWNDDSF